MKLKSSLLELANHFEFLSAVSMVRVKQTSRLGDEQSIKNGHRNGSQGSVKLDLANPVLEHIFSARNRQNGLNRLFKKKKQIKSMEKSLEKF